MATTTGSRSRYGATSSPGEMRSASSSTGTPAWPPPRAAGLLDVTVIYRDFATDAEALEYAIHNQRDRRNLTDAQIFKAVEAIDAPVTGFKTAIASLGAIAENPGKTANVTAKKAGTSGKKVERIRAIEKVPKLAAEVKAGKKSINRAYREIKGKSNRVTISLPRSHAQAVLRTLQRVKEPNAEQAAAIKAIEKAL